MNAQLRALIGVFVCMSALVSAQVTEVPALYITPSDGFEVYLAAAMHKKKVPVRVVLNPDAATHILTTTAIEFEKVSTGSRSSAVCSLTAPGPRTRRIRPCT